jgi:hypothetical protein
MTNVVCERRSSQHGRVAGILACSSILVDEPTTFIKVGSRLAKLVRGIGSGCLRIGFDGTKELYGSYLSAVKRRIRQLRKRRLPNRLGISELMNAD